MRTHLRVALITIFRTPKIATIVLCILQKRDKAADSDHVNRRFQAVAEENGGRQHHVAAVAATKNGNPVFIELRLLFHPVEQRSNIFNRVFAFKAIV